MEKAYFSDWLNRFSYHLRMRNYSQKTIQSYERVIRQFAYYIWFRRNAEPDRMDQYWKDRHTLGKLDTEVHVQNQMIEDFFAYITMIKPLKPTTLNRMISSLSSFYNYLYNQNVIDKNPMIRVERPKIKEYELRYMKHNQVLDLINSIEDERDRLIIKTIYATGVRVSEFCSISVENIDFESHTIRIKGKGDKIRTIFIDGTTLAELRHYLNDRKTGPIFCGHHGHHISPRTIQHIFRKYAPKGITPHKIRHSYASELYKRSKNLRVVQENLGHSSIKTTEIYLHTDIEERKKIYQEHFPLSSNHIE